MKNLFVMMFIVAAMVFAEDYLTEKTLFEKYSHSNWSSQESKAVVADVRHLLEQMNEKEARDFAKRVYESFKGRVVVEKTNDGKYVVKLADEAKNIFVIGSEDARKSDLVKMGMSVECLKPVSASSSKD